MTYDLLEGVSGPGVGLRPGMLGPPTAVGG